MMTKAVQRDRVFRCSFCTKPASEVQRLIAGNGVYICDECVGVCNEILTAHACSGPKGPVEWAPPWEAMTDDQALGTLPHIAASAARVDDNLRAWVQALRARGVTWARIGEALGMTRQSA